MIEFQYISSRFYLIYKTRSLSGITFLSTSLDRVLQLNLGDAVPPQFLGSIRVAIRKPLDLRAWLRVMSPYFGPKVIQVPINIVSYLRSAWPMGMWLELVEEKVTRRHVRVRK